MGNELRNSNLFISPKRNTVREENVLEGGVFKQAWRSRNEPFIERGKARWGHLFCPSTGFYYRRGGNAKGSLGDTEA